MMTDKTLDDYLEAYKTETLIKPSEKLVNSILDIPRGEIQLEAKRAFNVWRLFDMVLPRTIGWVVTCSLGIYLGIPASDPATNLLEEEYYIYGQAEIMLSEELNTEYFASEDPQ